MAHRTRIMYIEDKSGGLSGSARIGRVIYSKTGRSLYYQGRTFYPLAGRGFKANYYEVETGAHYWISGCRKDGTDALYSTTIEIDDDVREEYWTVIRQQPDSKEIRSFKSPGKYTR
ncbi:MAG: 1-deoxy-D-xylulose-5-phosphate synthase [Blastocatellia bacterium]